MKLSLFISCLLALPALAASPARPSGHVARNLEIPFQKFVLDNGLTVIVHEDHKAPIVAVNVWYHVGSKNEKPGKTGFAHLFEHLMFNGSENFNDDYFQALERVGATDFNGTTEEDRTNYFQNAPKSALDLLLWLESDRMGHLLGAITQAKLDEQRGVVQNEKRQGENQPYAVSEELITKSTFPAGHPYSWTVIGSMEDLNAAKLEDVREWFKTYYGAANSVIAIAGDVEAADVLARVKKYFGDIPSGPPVARYQTWIAKRVGIQRQTVQDRVPQARLYKVWNVPPWGTAEASYLRLAADVLGNGKNSRLYQRLVFNEQIATDTAALVNLHEIAGQFAIQVTARPGQDLARIERAVDEELARFLARGPSPTELQRVKTQSVAGFIRGAERIGGFGGKSDILIMNQVYGGRPDYYQTTLKHVQEATAKQLQSAAQQWLADGVYVLEVLPFPEFKTAATGADRTKQPGVDHVPDGKFPVLHRATLSNGLKIVLAERHAVPLIHFSLLVDAGYAADQFASPGAAQLAMGLLDEGTTKRTSQQISEELAQLGANLHTGSDLDSSTVSLSALKENLDRSLAIYADVILNPAFRDADFHRLQKLQLDAIQAEKAEPITMALRVFPAYLFGKGHAYGNPMTGSGTAASVTNLTRADAVKFHQTWFKSDNASLVIVGDTTLTEVLPKLEKLFGMWGKGEIPRKNIGVVAHQAKPVVYLMDRPGALQSIIFAGHVAPPKNNPEEIAIGTLNTILGGAFTSRLNMNLREDKHWAYGAGAFLADARGQRPFIAYAPVQTDKTKESMAEVAKELRGVLGDRPVTEAELSKTQRSQTLQLAGEWETGGAVGQSINQIVRFGLPDDYFDTYPGKVRRLDLQQVAAAARTVVHPDNLVWVVVGDREKIESGIRELGFGEVRLIDPDGNLIH